MFRAIVVGVVAVAGMAVGTPIASAGTVESKNWAGYLKSVDEGAFKTVRARWLVPEIQCEPNEVKTLVAVWVGLDGVKNSLVEQTGTASQCVGDKTGVPKYFSWVEMYPEPARALPLETRPGDTMSGRVKLEDGQFSFTIRNETLGKEHSGTMPCTAPGSSVEAVIEAPTGYRLPRFDPIRFHDVQVDEKPIGPLDPDRVVLVRAGEPPVVRAEPGDLSDDGTAFEVDFRDF